MEASLRVVLAQVSAAQKSVVSGNFWDEQHLVCECPAMALVRDRYNGPFRDHAATVLHFMWQQDICAFAHFIKECMDTQGDPDPQSQASDQP